MSLDVGALYAEHHRPLARYIRKRLDTRDLDLADDLASEVFVRAIRAAPRYQDRGFWPKTWLYRIAANLMTDYRRQDGRVRLQGLEAFQTAAYTLRWDQIDDRVTLDAALRTLPERQRATVVGRFLDDRPTTDLTDVGTPWAVKKLQVRALANLRRSLTGGRA